jgi:hypothetical protein
MNDRLRHSSFQGAALHNSKPACTAAAMALILACAQSPAEYPQTYRLVGLEDRPSLPVDLGEDRGCLGALVSGHIELGRDSYSSVFMLHRLCPGETPGTPEVTSEGDWEWTHRDSVVFRNQAGELTGRGRLAGDSLTITGPLHSLLFLRSAR